jgi:DNA polymerase-3 subunit gamma/tau
LVAADAGYRAASNARWHVEVALLDLVPDASSDEKKKPSRVADPEAQPAAAASEPIKDSPSLQEVPAELSAPVEPRGLVAPEQNAAVADGIAAAPTPKTLDVQAPESPAVEQPDSVPAQSPTVPAPQPASTAPRVRRTAFSLKDLDRNSAPAVPEEVRPTAEVVEPEAATTERKLRPFTQQALDNAWREAADAFHDLPVVRGILQTVVPVLERDAVVRVSLENKLQEDYLLAECDRLVPRLRQALHNDSLKIETLVEEGAVNARLVYTPDERYAFLLEKNPHLDDFRREFQLDIE